MALTASQQAFLRDKILKGWKNPKKCPICDGTTWTQGTICEVKEYNEGYPIAGAPLTPLVPVYCSVCGYTLFFNAIQFGLVDPINGRYVIK